MSARKELVVPAGLLRRLAEEHGTPLYVYDLPTMRSRVAELAGFDVVRYALKANSNLSVLATLRAAGVAADAVSAGEIVRAMAAGFTPAEIVFTADLFEPAALELVARHAIHVNAGSRGMLAELARARPAAEISLRLNPGFGSGYGASVRAGGAGSKHGIWHSELQDTLREACDLGLTVSGLHVHVGSGIEPEIFERAARAMTDFVRLAGSGIRSISAGGGLPIPYRAGESRPAIERYVETWQRTARALERDRGGSLTLETEPGRYLVAEAGILLASVRAKKRVGEHELLLVDAGFHTLARPVLYGAWHEIQALTHGEGELAPRVVAGPLCEPGDLLTLERGAFAPRLLPPLRAGDLIAILDTGAYGASMASNYNSHPLPAEVVVEGDRGRLARTRQTLSSLCANELDCIQRATEPA